MAMGNFESSGSGQPLSEINTTPLVDVMLVLLVIFIITAPLMTRAISLDLPKSDSPAVTAPQGTLNISINARGEVFLDKQPISREGLQSALEAAAAKSKQTPIHLRAERDTRYESVVEVMSLANRLGLSQLAFVTDLQKKSQ
ncbi:MAG: biopolymer transporter ExbD [Burkholderiaceae bacterium]|nr:biopolymer transporter ExbD [Burkholderiaceae bacterium]